MECRASFPLFDAADLKTCALRDQKMIAARLPRVFGGTGCHLEGDQIDTVPAFHQLLTRKLGAE